MEVRLMHLSRLVAIPEYLKGTKWAHIYDGSTYIGYLYVEIYLLCSRKNINLLQSGVSEHLLFSLKLISSGSKLIRCDDN